MTHTKPPLGEDFRSRQAEYLDSLDSDMIMKIRPDLAVQRFIDPV